MQRAALLLRNRNRRQQRRIGKKTPIRNRRIDARHIHAHNASRAKIQMANFRVTHLPIRQPHKVVARPQQRVRKIPQQRVVDRLTRQRNRIAVGLSSIAPAIENSQNNWFRHVTAE